MTAVTEAGVEPQTLLRRLEASGVLTPVDLRVAEAICRLSDEVNPDVRLAIALAARAPRHGHVCIELDRAAERVELRLAGDDEPVEEPLAWPDPEAWRDALAASPAVRAPGDERIAALVLDGSRLYLDRHWNYERRLEARLPQMAATTRDDTDPADVESWLDRLFGEADATEIDRQRLAAALASARSLTVVSGGPGTGKTTTIVKILALLLATVQRSDGAGPLRIALAAPTGKAAARMQEAIRGAVEKLPVDEETRSTLESMTAGTLHRLLGWRRDNSTRFRHDAENPLPYDVVVVDEASMVSLAVMSKLVDAVPAEGRLLLVGDRNQLVSVEAGAVLGDLCGGLSQDLGRTLRLSSSVVDDLAVRYGAPLTGEAEIVDEAGIWDSIVQLERFYRFGTDSGIGNVARAIQRVEDDPTEVIELLRSGGPGALSGSPDLAFVEEASSTIPGVVRERIVDGYRSYVEAVTSGGDPGEILAKLDEFRVLAAVRRGPRGVELLNSAIEGWLEQEVPDFSPTGEWYVGRPVMVTQNDYGVELFNGDVGVVVEDPHDPTERMVAFPAVGGEVRLVGPARLPPHETVFAMTVHKSQGSQFDRVVVVLPTQDSPILTRELIYTGVTRAKEHVMVVGEEGLLRSALVRPVQRASGLAERLWS